MPTEIADQLVVLLPRLRRYARVLARATDIADDLVQAACERALAAERGPGNDVPFDAWMLRIVRNLWIDRARRDRSAGTLLDIDEHPDEAANAGHAPDPADVADARRTLVRVREAIDALPEAQREVLLLVCAEGLAYRDAADLIGVPIGTVMSRLARARTRLAALAGIADGDEGISEDAARFPQDRPRRALPRAAAEPDAEP